MFEVSAGNICVQKWDYNYHQSKHRQKIRSMRPTIDTAPPKSCFLRHLQMGRDHTARQQATAKASQDDLKMIKVIAETMTRPLHMPDPNKGHFSLNRDYRNREIRRIVNENQQFYRRLLKAKGQLSYAKQMKDHHLQQEFMINSSHTMRYQLRNNLDELDWPLSFRSKESSPRQVPVSPNVKDESF